MKLVTGYSKQIRGGTRARLNERNGGSYDIQRTRVRGRPCLYFPAVALPELEDPKFPKDATRLRSNGDEQREIIFDRFTIQTTNFRRIIPLVPRLPLRPRGPRPIKIGLLYHALVI
jgi:hypothetical protein